VGVGATGARRRKEDEAMSSVRVLSIAGAALWLALPAAHAADMPMSPPSVVYQPTEEFGGWYLRGDIGMSNQAVDHLYNVLYDTAVGLQQVSRGFEGAPFFVLGFGYRFNSWLRADVTGEYRSGSTFHGLDIYGIPPSGTDEYTGIKSEWVVLANLYADLGTWWCVTPFVGVSAGFSYNKIANFIDVNTPTGGVAFGADAWKANFAWGATAGLAYNVTRNVTIELAYRYLNLGDAQSGDLIAYTGANTVNNPMIFKGITSQDLKLGVRFLLEPEPVSPPSLMRKG
jgi:opacity protein-like surface antigen